MTTCHQRHVCDDFLPALRRRLDAIERDFIPRPSATRGNSCDIPDACGPVWWAAFEAVAASVGCEHCRPDAESLVRLMHDMVNVKRGKAPFAPADARRWHPIWERVEEQVGLAGKTHCRGNAAAPACGLRPCTGVGARQ